MRKFIGLSLTGLLLILVHVVFSTGKTYSKPFGHAAFALGIAAAANGTLYIADPKFDLDTSGMRIRRIAPNGIIDTVAGTGQTPPPTCAPDGPATSVGLSYPQHVVFAPDGALYFSEAAGSHRIRKLQGGQITTVAGGASGCASGYSADGGPATSARLANPRGLALAPDGSLYIADSINAVVRRVTPDGMIDRVAGVPTGVGDTGDGGPALLAKLQNVGDLALGPDGSLYLTQENHHRVRRMEALHTAFDIVGLIPFFGEVADIANMAIYLAEGDCRAAMISLAASIPAVGMAVIAGKWAVKAARKGAGFAPIRNVHLAGKNHPVTGVPFDAKGYPDFSKFRHPDVPDVHIQLSGSRSTDFSRANAAAGLKQTPGGYTWHHHQDKGLMQLIETNVHKHTGHTGGFSNH